MFGSYDCLFIASSRDLFRSTRCLEYVADLVKITTSQEVLQAGLYTLASATENNGKVQKHEKHAHFLYMYV